MQQVVLDKAGDIKFRGMWVCEDLQLADFPPLMQCPVDSQGVLAGVGGKEQSGCRGVWQEDLWDPLGMGKREGREVAAGAIIITQGYFWGLVLQQLKKW